MADAKEGMTTNEAGQPVSEAPDAKDIEDIGPKSPKEAVQDLIEKSKKSKKGTKKDKKVAEKTVVGGGGEEIGKAEGFVTGGGDTGGKTAQEKVQEVVEKEAKKAGVDSDKFKAGKAQKVDTAQERQIVQELRQKRQQRGRQEAQKTTTKKIEADTRAELAKKQKSRVEKQLSDIEKKQEQFGQKKESMIEKVRNIPEDKQVVLNGKVMSKQAAIQTIKKRKLRFSVGEGKRKKSALQLKKELGSKKEDLSKLIQKRRKTPGGRVALGEGKPEDIAAATYATIVSPRSFSLLGSLAPGSKQTPEEVIQQTAEQSVKTGEKYGRFKGSLVRGAGALTSLPGMAATTALVGGAASGGISAVSSVSSTAGAVTGATAKAAGGFLVGMEVSRTYQAAEEGDVQEAVARGTALGTAVGGAYYGSKVLGPTFAQGFKTAGSKLKRLPGSSRKGMFGPDLSKTVKAPKGQTFESKIVKTGGKQAFRSRMPKTVRFFKGGYKGGGTKAMLRRYMQRKQGFKKTQTKPQRMTEQEFKGKEVSGGRQKLLQKQKPQTETKTSEKIKIKTREELLEGMKKFVSKPKTTAKTSKMTITGVPPTEKMKQKEKLSIKEYTKEAEKMGLKLKQKSDLKLKQEQELKTATEQKLSTKQKQKLKTGLEGKTGLKEKEKQLLDLDVTSRLKQKERPKPKLRGKLKTGQRLKQKPKQVPAVKQELALKLGLKQKLRQRQLEEQKLRTTTLSEQATRTTPKTGGAGLLDLPSKGRVKGRDVGEVRGAKAEETEPWPKVDVISGSLARWQTGKFKTPAGPEAREEFKTKSPLKGFRSVEEREAGGFSVFDTKEVNFY